MPGSTDRADHSSPSTLTCPCPSVISLVATPLEPTNLSKDERYPGASRTRRNRVGRSTASMRMATATATIAWTRIIPGRKKAVRAPAAAPPASMSRVKSPVSISVQASTAEPTSQTSHGQSSKGSITAFSRRQISVRGASVPSAINMADGQRHSEGTRENLGGQGRLNWPSSHDAAVSHDQGMGDASRDLLQVMGDEH